MTPAPATTIRTTRGALRALPDRPDKARPIERQQRAARLALRGRKHRIRTERET